MRILYTHRTQGVGAEGVHIMGMVEAFRDAGHEVTLDGLPGCDPFERDKAIGDVNDERGAQRSAWRNAGYRLIADHAPQIVFGMAELLYNLPLAWRLWRRIRRHRPDLMYERYAVGNFAPALVCRLMRIPLVVEVNDSVVIDRSRPLSFASLKRAIERRVLRSAALVVTVSQRFKAQILEAFPDLGTKILVCPNAVSERRFRLSNMPPDDALRSRLGLAGRKVVLGSAGQFVRWHGLAEFVGAMSGVARELDAAFLFIGDGPVRPEVMAAARAAGIEERVIFTGMIPHAMVPSHLALLDLAVIPFSNIHGSPMKLMEFMAMALPVIAPDLPPIREVIDDRRTGRIFRNGDMDDMRKVLLEMLADAEACRGMGQHARTHVLSNLTWAAHARHCLDALSSRRDQPA